MWLSAWKLKPYLVIPRQDRTHANVIGAGNATGFRVIVALILVIEWVITGDVQKHGSRNRGASHQDNVVQFCRLQFFGTHPIIGG